jgi:tight adherence protein B
MLEGVSTPMLLVGVALAAAAIFMFGQFLYWSVSATKEDKERELSRRIGVLQEKESSPLLRFGQLRKEGGFASTIDELIRQAGSPYTSTTLFQRMLVAGGIGVAALAILMKSPVALAGAALGALPYLSLSRAADSRQARLTEQLPDALDLLARSLQAGHGLSEAMRLVAEELPEPIATEFGRVHEENQLGRDLRDCIHNLCRRNPRSFDLRIFASSVLLQRDTGGNLIEILYGISNTIRDRFVFQGKLGALTSEARFTAWILGGLPFVIGTLIALMSPHYLVPLYTDRIGQAAMVFAMMWFALGVTTMRELSKVDV